jgi:hypothetical protein
MGRAVSATLRRADWRYLLPPPCGKRYRHLLLLGGPAGLADLLRAEEIAERVDTAPVRGADLVVAMADCAASPSALATYLAPGGVLYREIDRRRLGMLATTPGRLAASLRASGLGPISSHWIIPELASARRYLPLDHPGALRWYFGTLHPAGSVPGAVTPGGLPVGLQLVGRYGAERELLAIAAQIEGQHDGSSYTNVPDSTN